MESSLNELPWEQQQARCLLNKPRRFIRSSEAPGHDPVTHRVNGDETPSVILDVFEGRVTLLAFNQETDEPRVLVEFGDKGEIVRVVIDGVPFAIVVQQPVRPGAKLHRPPIREKTRLVCGKPPCAVSQITDVQSICAKKGDLLSILFEGNRNDPI